MQPKPLALPRGRRRGITHAPFPAPDTTPPVPVAAFPGVEAGPSVAQLTPVAGGSAVPFPGRGALTQPPFPRSESTVRLAAVADRMEEVQRTLTTLEAQLAERERVVQDNEARVVERERELAEAEALLAARERILLASARRRRTTKGTPQERQALQQFKEELDRQEAQLLQRKDELRERERFLDESETRLFEKVQAHQEKETELEQREDEIIQRERRLREREARIDPAAADALRAEAARERDEFKE